MNSGQESAWLAGILEGEGCFRVTHDLRSPGSRPSLRVKLAMTDKDVIERAALMMSTGNATVRFEKARSENFKASWSIQWTGQRAENVMRRVFPYMGIRRKAKIEECLTATDLSHHTRT